jgi:Spy/CpxP family protein refolding chaperone
MNRFFNIVLLVFIFTWLMLPVSARQQQTDAEKEQAYTKVVTQRAEKIVKTLNISNVEKSARVRDIIAGQYRYLNTIHDSSDAKINTIEEKKELSKEKREELIANIKTETEADLDELHKEYLRKLSADLTPEEVEKVKDGMTYGVLPITYKGYLDMIPELTAEQKKQIMDWLIEAREHAMDAGSSEKKHWWFGKYKGRINNYLSAAGYDLKKAGEEWEKRRKAEKTK